MLKVLPIQSKEEQEKICGKCGVVYKPELLAYGAEVDGVIVGVCQFTLSADGGIIYDLEPAIGTDDFEAMFIMGRSTLNFIDLCGVHKAYYDGKISDEKSENLIKKVGFEPDGNGRLYMDLTDFFNNPCGHNKK